MEKLVVILKEILLKDIVIISPMFHAFHAFHSSFGAQILQCSIALSHHFGGWNPMKSP